MPPRVRIMPPGPPAFPPFPDWARVRIVPAAVVDAGVLAGAALAAIHPIARDDHAVASLWRQRLALASAAALARFGGRAEDEAALRDAWYLRRAGDDPGPAGRLLSAWRRLGEPGARRPQDWPRRLAALDLGPGAAEICQAVGRLSTGEGTPLAAAVAAAAVAIRLRPDVEPLALWLADAVLAARMGWPAPVPLLAAQVRRADVSVAARHLDGDPAWLAACCVAYARGAAAAADLHGDLVRRAGRLLAAAPKLRGRDADEMVGILLTEDAQPARTGRRASDRSGRRLFDRLVALGAVRELTGRPTFRLYGL